MRAGEERVSDKFGFSLCADQISRKGLCRSAASVVLFGFLFRLVVAEFCYYLEGEGARDSGIVHCTVCLLQEPLYMYIYLYFFFKRERSLLWGEGETCPKHIHF